MSGVAPDSPDTFDPKHEVPMTSPWKPVPDPLDRIQHWAETKGHVDAYERDCGFSFESVLALVEVARAAHAVVHAAWPVDGEAHVPDAEMVALGAALARLEKSA